MAIGRNIEESLKACRSLEIGVHHNEMPELVAVSDDALIEKLSKLKMTVSSMSEAIRRVTQPEEIARFYKIDIFYLDKLLHIFEIEQELGAHPQDIDVLKIAKLNGFSDRKIVELWETTADQVRQLSFGKQDCPSLQDGGYLCGRSLTLKHHISIQPMVGKMNLSSLIRNLYWS